MIIEKIKKIAGDADDSILKEILGDKIYKNVNDLYNKLKKDKKLHTLFYEDYLQEEKLNKSFVVDLLENECHIDYEKPFSDEDYHILVSEINEGYGNGDMIAYSISKITDAYIGDGFYEY